MKKYFLILILSLSCLNLSAAQETTSTQTETEGLTLNFQEAMNLALQNPTVTLAKSQLELAEKQLAVASGVISAELSADYSSTWGDSTNEITGDVTSLDNRGIDDITLQATFNVVPYGPTADTITKARWSVQRAQYELYDTQLEQLVNVASLYLTALRDTQEAQVLQNDVRVAEAKLEAVRAQEDVGAANDAQLLSAEIVLSQAQSDYGIAEQERVQSLAQLSQALGVNVTQVEGEPGEVNMPEITDYEQLLLNRSDVINAQLAVEEAKLNRDSTLRDYLPSGSVALSLNSTSTDQSFSLSTGFNTNTYQPSVSASFNPGYESNSSSKSVSVSLGVSIPLETATPAAIRAARVTIEQSELQAEQTLELARLELAGRLNDVQAAQATVALSEKLVEQSKQQFDIAKERFELGVISVLDVNQAEQDYLEAQLQHAQATDSYVLALMQLNATLAMNPMEVF